MRRVRYWLWGLILTLLAIAAGLWWRQPFPAPPPEPTLSVTLASRDPFFLLPYLLAKRLGTFADLHLEVREAADAPVQLVAPLAGPKPVTGYLALYPDLVLVSPEPDPHFRLVQIKELPLAYQADADVLPWATRVFAQHHVQPREFEALSTSAILRLWSSGRLPYAVVDLPLLLRLQQQRLKPSVLAFFGASTGPLPAFTVNGKSANLDRLLAGFNLALWYLHTHSSHAVAQLLGGADGLSSAEWEGVIRLGLHYRLWPSTTYPDAARWRRLSLFWPTVPSYPAAVDPTPALAALRSLP